MLAAKAAIATRCDALGEGEQSSNVGTDGRTRVEMRLKALESGHIRKISGTGKKQTTEKYDAHKTEHNFKKYYLSYSKLTTFIDKHQSTTQLQIQLWTHLSRRTRTESQIKEKYLKKTQIPKQKKHLKKERRRRSRRRKNQINAESFVIKVESGSNQLVFILNICLYVVS
jgi:RNA processing factor Prp31